MDLRLRASLLVHMAVASCILLTLALVVGLFMGVLGGGLGLMLAEPFQLVVTRLASLPRVSAVTPLPPAAVAAVGLATVVGAVRGWSAVRARTRFERLLPRTTPGLVVVAAAVLGCLYTVAVETCAAVVARLSVPAGLLLLAVAFGGLAVWTMVREVRKRIRTLRTRIVADSSLLEHTEPQVASTVRWLAQLADVPEPSVRVVGSERPSR